MKKNSTKAFSLFFLTGKDHRLLNKSQQKQILKFLTNQKYSSSVMVYNSQETIRKYRYWKERLPWIKVHYAVKANPTEVILKDLINEGSSFDCASKNQIQLLLSMGVNPERIVYSNSVKQQTDLELAGNNGINLTTADTIYQLQKILKHAPHMRILWRIAIKQQQSDKLSSIFSEKFGDDFKGNFQIMERMIKIKNMGINLKGIHFHCGSGHHGSSGFSKGISLARQCIKIGRQCGHDMQILNIGGGYPGGQLHQNLIEVLKTTQNDPLNYQVFAEPGENLCKTSFYLLMKVLGKRKTRNGQTNFYLNESTYHSFYLNTLDVNDLWDVNEFYSSINTKSNQPQKIQKTQVSTLFGMTSDQNDIIAKNVQVPIDLDISDWLCLSGMGAYYYSAKSSFSGLRAADTILQWNADVHSNKKLQPKLQTSKEFQKQK